MTALRTSESRFQTLSLHNSIARRGGHQKECQWSINRHVSIRFLFPKQEINSALNFWLHTTGLVSGSPLSSLSGFGWCHNSAPLGTHLLLSMPYASNIEDKALVVSNMLPALVDRCHSWQLWLLPQTYNLSDLSWYPNLPDPLFPKSDTWWMRLYVSLEGRSSISISLSGSSPPCSCSSSSPYPGTFLSHLSLAFMLATWTSRKKN